MKTTLFVLAVFFLITFPVAAQDSSNVVLEEIALEQKQEKNLFGDVDGFLDFNGYFDTRDSSIFTLNTLIKFPFMVDYFSFVNVFGGFGTTGDLNDYYTEQNIHFNSSKLPVDAGVQWVSASKFRDLIRIGPRFRVHDFPLVGKYLKKLNLIYELSYFPVQFDGNSDYDYQFEHFYRVQVLPSVFGDRVYISGFIDHNIFDSAIDGKNSLIVTEHQIGVRTYKQLYLVSEYRYNEFVRKSKRNGVAFGLEYIFNF